MQEAIVALLVISATLESVWKLMPARARLRTLMALDRRAARLSSLAGFRERLLKPRLLRAAGSGCAGCAAKTGARPNPPR
jgi:hypothetical protein